MQGRVMICIRWVDDRIEAGEDYIGLHKIERADASIITALLKDCFNTNDSFHKQS